MAKWRKPSLDTKFAIDMRWWERSGNNFRLHLRDSLCPECYERAGAPGNTAGPLGGRRLDGAQELHRAILQRWVTRPGWQRLDRCHHSTQRRDPTQHKPPETASFSSRRGLAPDGQSDRDTRQSTEGIPWPSGRMCATHEVRRPESLTGPLPQADPPWALLDRGSGEAPVIPPSRLARFDIFGVAG